MLKVCNCFLQLRIIMLLLNIRFFSESVALRDREGQNWTTSFLAGFHVGLLSLVSLEYWFL